ncbi:unnamed protein product, partial [Urochloa humidicola]
CRNIDACVPAAGVLSPPQNRRLAHPPPSTVASLVVPCPSSNKSWRMQCQSREGGGCSARPELYRRGAGSPSPDRSSAVAATVRRAGRPTAVWAALPLRRSGSRTPVWRSAGVARAPRPYQELHRRPSGTPPESPAAMELGRPAGGFGRLEAMATGSH